MIKRLLLIAVLGVTVSGCFMAPIALIGPATSGFSTASLIQSGVSTGASYVVKKSTGKTVTQHIQESLNKDVLEQTYAPKIIDGEIKKPYDPTTKLTKRCRKFDFYCQRMLKDNPQLAKSLLPKLTKDIGCKKYDYYCKRMGKKKWLKHIDQEKSLLGSL